LVGTVLALSKLACFQYRITQEDSSSPRIPAGFAAGKQWIIILFHDGHARRLEIDRKLQESKTLITLDLRQHPFASAALQLINEDNIAVLYSSINQSFSELKRFIAFYSKDRGLFTKVEFPWNGWDPAGRTFLVTPGGKYIFPHDRKLPENHLDHKKHSHSKTPLLDLYDEEGHKLRSFGIAQAHGDTDMACVLNRGHLSCHLNGDVYFAFQYPYLLYKFNSEGYLIWEKKVDLPFPFHPPAMEESRKTENEVSVTWQFSRGVKDLCIGRKWIAVLAASSQIEVSERFGSRIDRFTFDGEHFDSSILDQPANFIQFDSKDHLWVLYEFEGEVAQYQFG
jgi:hypothetical protein